MRRPRKLEFVKLYETKFNLSPTKLVVSDGLLRTPGVVHRCRPRKLEQTYSYSALSESSSTSNVSTQFTSDEVSTEVIPPSSPRLGLISKGPSTHKCINPVECASKLHRFRKSYDRRRVLSYLPPFRYHEDVTSNELRARRLYSYFHQYPAEPLLNSPLCSRLAKLRRSVSAEEGRRLRDFKHRGDEWPDVVAGSKPLASSVSNFDSPSSSPNSIYCCESRVPGHVVPTCRSPTSSCKGFQMNSFVRSPAFGFDTRLSDSQRGVGFHMSVCDNCGPTTNRHNVSDGGLKLSSRVLSCSSEINSQDWQSQKANDSFPSSCLPLEGSSDLSVWLPYSLSSSSSTFSLTCQPERVSSSHEPPSPFLSVLDPDPSTVHDEESLTPGEITASNTKGFMGTRIRTLPVEAEPKIREQHPSPPGSSSVILPSPPSVGSKLIDSSESFCWPPTPSDLLASPPTTVNGRTLKRCTICLNVTNIMISPCDTMLSVSPTIISPPTEVVLVDSSADKRDVLSSPGWINIPSKHHLVDDISDTNISRVGIGGFGDLHIRRSRLDSVSDTSGLSHKRSGLTYRLPPSGSVRIKSALDQGDCLQPKPTPHDSLSATSFSTTVSRGMDVESNGRKAHVSTLDLSSCLPVRDCRTSTDRYTYRSLKPCLSNIYASIQSMPLTTTQRRLRQRYSSSVDSLNHRPTSYSFSLSRPNLAIMDEANEFSQLFTIPDVQGLQKAVSNYGSPLSPSQASAQTHTGTRGRPTDRRLYRILQRYAGSRADMLGEIQHLHGQEYAFLVLHTQSWNHMVCMVRDLDQCFPQWQLGRQLYESR